MKTLDSLNDRIETIHQSIENTEQIVADLQKELEETKHEVQELARKIGMMRWIELGLALVGVIGLVLIYLWRPEFIWIIAGGLAFILVIIVVLEISAGKRRRTLDQAMEESSRNLEQKTAILESRYPQLERRLQERNDILDTIKRIESLEVPYVSNFVRRYETGTAEQRSHFRELLMNERGIEVSEELLVDLLEKELDTQRIADFRASFSGLTSMTDYLTRFITTYRGKREKTDLLRLLRENRLVDGSFTVKELDEALKKREHEMRVKDFGATLETPEE